MKKAVQTLKKVCKKILFIALLFVVISSNYANALFPIGNSYNSTTVYANSRQQRVVLFTRVLSRQEVKALAASQKNARNFANSFASIISKTPGKYKYPAKALAFILRLSGNAQFNRTVQNAARNNKRLLLRVTDYKNYHTSYSLQNEYTIIN